MTIAPWSFSKIKAFEQCPKQFYHMKILKQYEEKETEAMLYGTHFHSAAEEYIKNCTPMPGRFDYAVGVLDSLQAKQGKKLCEYRLGLTLELEPCGFSDKDVWFRGIADLIILNDDLAWVVDYKTGKSARYADKGQLELMALAAFKHFPEVEEVRAGLLFVVSKNLNGWQTIVRWNQPQLMMCGTLAQAGCVEGIARLPSALTMGGTNAVHEIPSTI